jgi:hypothetical protein
LALLALSLSHPAIKNLLARSLLSTSLLGPIFPYTHWPRRAYVNFLGPFGNFWAFLSVINQHFDFSSCLFASVYRAHLGLFYGLWFTYLCILLPCHCEEPDGSKFLLDLKTWISLAFIGCYF